MDIADGSKRDWIDLITQSFKADNVPDGYLTFDQLLVNMGICKERLRKRLMTLLSDGKVERRIFRVKTASGRLYPVQHWKILK